jgi:HlyD family secretion protein
VFVYFEGKAVRRPVKAASTSSQGVEIQSGLIGGEELIVDPPAGLKDGDKVRQKV